MPEKSSPNVDIFELLSDSRDRAKKKRREELLASSGVKEFFAEGKISIDKLKKESVSTNRYESLYGFYKNHD